MSLETKTIAESNNFIVLDKYTKIEGDGSSYQSEADLENELIKDLDAQGIKYESDINTPEKLLVNVRVQLQDCRENRTEERKNSGTERKPAAETGYLRTAGTGR
jgi:hypothetical protein